MRFSIAIPQFDYDGFDGAGLRSYLARAEELGFEGGWVLEQTIGAAPLLAPLELLAYCAACTERLRLGVAVLVSSLHDPLQLASSITAVDRLSHGRLDVGVAPGGGARQIRRVRRGQGLRSSAYFTEGLELMKAAWSDEPTGDVPRPVPRRRRPADPAQAGAAPAPADLVRRPGAQGAGQGGAPR